MDLANDLFRVSVAADGPDDDVVIATIAGTGFTATRFPGVFHVDAGATTAPQGDAVPEPVREALVRAQDAGKLVLVDFFAEWCKPCKQMLEDVYSEDRVAALLARRYVFLAVDTDRFPEAGKPYGVAGIPDARLLAADGRQVGRIFGYQSADAVLQLLAAAEEAAGLPPLAPVPSAADAVAAQMSPQTPEDKPSPAATSPTRTVLRVEGMT